MLTSPNMLPPPVLQRIKRKRNIWIITFRIRTKSRMEILDYFEHLLGVLEIKVLSLLFECPSMRLVKCVDVFTRIVQLMSSLPNTLATFLLSSTWFEVFCDVEPTPLPPSPPPAIKLSQENETHSNSKCKSMGFWRHNDVVSTHTDTHLRRSSSPSRSCHTAHIHTHQITAPVVGATPNSAPPLGANPIISCEAPLRPSSWPVVYECLQTLAHTHIHRVRMLVNDGQAGWYTWNVIELFSPSATCDGSERSEQRPRQQTIFRPKFRHRLFLAAKRAIAMKRPTHLLRIHNSTIADRGNIHTNTIWTLYICRRHRSTFNDENNAIPVINPQGDDHPKPEYKRVWECVSADLLTALIYFRMSVCLCGIFIGNPFGANSIRTHAVLKISRTLTVRRDVTCDTPQRLIIAYLLCVPIVCGAHLAHTYVIIRLAVGRTVRFTLAQTIGEHGYGGR